jgi:hypothetical protein
MLAIGWAISEAGLRIGEVSTNSHLVEEGSAMKRYARITRKKSNGAPVKLLQIRMAGMVHEYETPVRMVRSERDIDITLTCRAQRI